MQIHYKGPITISMHSTILLNACGNEILEEFIPNKSFTLLQYCRDNGNCQEIFLVMFVITYTTN